MARLPLDHGLPCDVVAPPRNVCCRSTVSAYACYSSPRISDGWACVGKQVASTLVFVGDDDARYSHPLRRKSRDSADLNLSLLKEVGLVFLRYASTSNVSTNNLVRHRSIPCHDSTFKIVEALGRVSRFDEFNRSELRSHSTFAINDNIGFLWN